MCVIPRDNERLLNADVVGIIMIASFSIVPLDQGESVSEQVAECLRIVRESGLPHRLTPMATIIEGETDEVMATIMRCHAAVRSASKRVLTRIEIDDREGVTDGLVTKMRSVESKL